MPGPAKTDDSRSGSLIAAGGSRIISFGDVPEGYGQSLMWDRKDNQILLVAFINPASPAGACIYPLLPGDIINVSSASGLASFTKDQGNPLAESIVSLIAAGAKVGITAAGYPEAIPLISAGEKFAKDQFKATNKQHKVRDAYGVDPGSGHKAKQEGGIIVCLPGSGGPILSGNNDHRERWIKEPGDRVDANLPVHVTNSFFLRRGPGGTNARTVQAPGEAYILAWDHFHEDNVGCYQLFIHISKASPPKPPQID
jgi:hypothetical protein